MDLIRSAWDGTPVETWVSAEGVRRFGRRGLAGWGEKACTNLVTYRQSGTDFKAWQTQLLREDYAHPDMVAYTAPAERQDRRSVGGICGVR